MRADLLTILPIAVGAINIVQSNDDGWAEINLRTLNKALNDAGNSVVLSGPAENQSGRSSLDAAPTQRTEPCQYDSCPANSPPIGSDPSNPRFQYVNSYPVTSIKNGINTLGPKFFNGRKPDFAVTGPNVGSNLDIQVPFSGTVGAAVEAVKNHGIPAIAFSGASGDPTSYTAATPLYSQVYADLATNLTEAVIASGTPYLPPNVWLNVNFPEVSDSECSSASDFKFVLSRINPKVPFISDDDIEICGDDSLPMERTVVNAGCYVSVSPGDASDKTTIDAAGQQIVYNKLKNLLSCLP